MAIQMARGRFLNHKWEISVDVQLDMVCCRIIMLEVRLIVELISCGRKLGTTLGVRTHYWLLQPHPRPGISCGHNPAKWSVRPNNSVDIVNSVLSVKLLYSFVFYSDLFLWYINSKFKLNFIRYIILFLIDSIYIFFTFVNRFKIDRKYYIFNHTMFLLSAVDSKLLL